MEKRFGIALITNDAYVDATIILMKTFLNNNKWFHGDFIIMHDNKYCTLTEESKNVLKQQYDHVYFHCVEEGKYDKFVEHFKEVLTFSRFVVSVFTVESFALKYNENGEEYDKVLYLDVDQIVNGDISDLFFSDKDIICGPGDNFIHNKIDFNLLKRDRENIGGGLFCIGKKYLGEDVRDEIIRFAENFKLFNEDNGEWDGTCFEMHVLNMWLLDKEVYILPSIYQFPSVLYFKIYEDKMSDDFKIIRDELFKNFKILHIWYKKPWMKTTNNIIDNIDRLWFYYYKHLLNKNSDIKEMSLDEIYSQLVDTSGYKKYNTEEYRRIFCFYNIETTYTQQIDLIDNSDLNYN